MIATLVLKKELSLSCLSALERYHLKVSSTAPDCETGRNFLYNFGTSKVFTSLPRCLSVDTDLHLGEVQKKYLTCPSNI